MRRHPCENELKATAVLALGIEEASVKIRTGPPADDEADYSLPVWAGVIPIASEARLAEPDPRLAAGIAVPDSAARYTRPGAAR